MIVQLGETEWIDEIRIFGSRRYLSNASYGSDIDLLIVPNRQVQIDKLRAIIRKPYIDAFMLDGGLAISAMNDTRINVAEAQGAMGLDAEVLWSRAKGWLTGEDYRTLDIIPDKVPTTTRPNVGAIILFCALASEFNAVRKRLHLTRWPRRLSTMHSWRLRQSSTEYIPPVFHDLCCFLNSLANKSKHKRSQQKP
ncbi:MAG TPA: hypothetical protein VFK06_02750 [Candidatus Angelobacter sp.]|nr:hypothetical protein [Candidatus Angelobacter sp.]